MASLNLARSFNARHAPERSTIPEVLVDLFPGLGEARDSRAFANATRALQRYVGAKADGYFGPDTMEAVLTWARQQVRGAPAPPVAPPRRRVSRLNGAYVHSRPYRVRRAKRTMLFADFRLPEPGEAMERWADKVANNGFTHVTIGVNNVSIVKKSHTFKWIGHIKARLKDARDALRARGVSLILMVWVCADEAFMDDVAALVGPVCRALGCPLMLDAEEDWVRARANFEQLVARFVVKWRTHGVPLLSTVLYFFHRNAQGLVLACEGGCVIQAYTFRNPKRPGTMRDDYLPGILQARTALMAFFAKILAAGIRVWWGMAAYMQRYEGVTDAAAMLASAAAAMGLVGVSEDLEANLAWWSERNADQNPTERYGVMMSFAPPPPPGATTIEAVTVAA